MQTKSSLSYIYKILVAISLAFSFTACGGGGGGGTKGTDSGSGDGGKPPVQYNGTVVKLVDGYIKNANVSANVNGTKHEATYSKNGTYTFKVELPKTAVIVAKGGSQEATNLENKMTYEVKADVEVISPLTSFANKFPDQAKALKESLGIDKLDADYVATNDLKVAKLNQYLYVLEVKGLTEDFSKKVKKTSKEELKDVSKAINETIDESKLKDADKKELKDYTKKVKEIPANTQTNKLENVLVEDKKKVQNEDNGNSGNSESGNSESGSGESGSGESGSSGSGDQKPSPDPTPTPTSGAIIIDHKTDKLGQIPAEWINKAKANLHILYQGASHSRQMTRGMRALAQNGTSSLKGYKGKIYQVDVSGNAQSGSLDLKEGKLSGNWGAHLANTPNFDESTITYLDSHPEINVVFWMWCWQRGEWNNADASAGNVRVDIDNYLAKMKKLVSMYGKNGSKIGVGGRTQPVTFVYATGPTQENRTGSSENENKWVFDANNKIRQYVKTNGGVLFDFYDLESYDPSEKYFGDGDGSATDVYSKYTGIRDLDDDHYYKPNGSSTRSGNWVNEYISKNNSVAGVDYFNYLPSLPPEHSHALDGTSKTYAMWWLFARLAGWDGVSQ